MAFVGLGQSVGRPKKFRIVIYVIRFVILYCYQIRFCDRLVPWFNVFRKKKQKNTVTRVLPILGFSLLKACAWGESEQKLIENVCSRVRTLYILNVMRPHGYVDFGLVITEFIEGFWVMAEDTIKRCLLYTSDAADE